MGFNTFNQMSDRWNAALRGGLDIYANWGDDVDAAIGPTPIPYFQDDNDAGVRPFIGADVEFSLNERAKLDFGAEGAYDTINAVFGSINAGFSVLF